MNPLIQYSNTCFMSMKSVFHKKSVMDGYRFSRDSVLWHSLGSPPSQLKQGSAREAEEHGMLGVPSKFRVRRSWASVLAWSSCWLIWQMGEICAGLHLQFSVILSFVLPRASAASLGWFSSWWQSDYSKFLPHNYISCHLTSKSFCVLELPADIWDTFCLDRDPPSLAHPWASSTAEVTSLVLSIS